MQPLSNIRREYSQANLNKNSLSRDPFVQFERWMAEAVESGLSDPTAMTIATVDASGQPSQRIVLLKDVSKQGFVFYTNLASRKAQDIAVNKRISLHFPWHALERQVLVRGRAEMLEREEIALYFATRPRLSQLAAWTSKQSEPIASREALLARFEKIKHKFQDDVIPVPEFWGGYRVLPQEIEFWQGGDHRLHDRFVFSRESEEDKCWTIQRLMP
ncbi:MAG: pyridoxamine 5'-phosphate oxidase [Paraglaciecola sp.]|jgi:pyridoxamine 5'-phosphate oxidase